MDAALSVSKNDLRDSFSFLAGEGDFFLIFFSNQFLHNEIKLPVHLRCVHTWIGALWDKVFMCFGWWL